MKFKTLKFLVFVVLFSFAANTAKALEMPTNFLETEILGLTAKSYMVVDEDTGETVVSKDSDLLWPPASLTKLVTALVVLDYNPKLTGRVTFQETDEVGGARLAVKAKSLYNLKDLFYASLIASANNATVAMSRSTGLTSEQFLEKMNEKAKSLGAKNTIFLEPSGMNEKNVSTVEDYVKIAATAFQNPQILKAASLKSYSFRSLNGKKQRHIVKNTNKLLGDKNLEIIAGKTGYLEESERNFVTKVKTLDGKKFIVCVFGSKDGQTQFTETRELALYAAVKLKDMKNVLGINIKN